jgi:hypothetical protein
MSKLGDELVQIDGAGAGPCSGQEVRCTRGHLMNMLGLTWDDITDLRCGSNGI